MCVCWQENVMTNIEQAKSMARQLRAALASEGIDIPHSKSLEYVAKTLGHADWNTASATIDPTGASPDKVQFLRTSPTLRIFDENKAREFYCDFLGFSVTFEHRFSDGLPLYLGLDRGDLSLHLTEHHGDASPGANVFVATRNIRAFHQELAAKNYAFNSPALDELPWGLQVQVNDPFFNRIRFCQQDD
jgi:catechol 2,3-dioxygenase-like lactoylglutathione lyase family enzyme